MKLPYRERMERNGNDISKTILVSGMYKVSEIKRKKYVGIYCSGSYYPCVTSGYPFFRLKLKGVFIISHDSYDSC